MVTRDAETDRASAAEAPWLLDVVGLLWPGATVTPVSMWSVHGRVDGSVDLLALPSRAHPSILVPAQPRAAAAALRGSKTGAPARTRRVLRLLAAGARLGGVSVLPSRLRVTPAPGRDDSFVRWVGARLGESPRVAILNSPPRANRKPVVQLISPAGDTWAYAKIGSNELTCRLVRAEGEALERLGALVIPGVRVPRLLQRGEWNGCDVIVQQHLVPMGDQAWAPDELATRMRSFAVAAGTRTGPVTASPYLDRLTRRLDALPTTASSAALRQTLVDLASGGHDTPLTLGQWHGDWTPWNMARSGGDLLLWDLERAEWGAPVGFDDLHHRLQGSIVRDGVTALSAARSLLLGSVELLAGYELSEASAMATARLYLVELGTRYLADGQREAGGALSALEDWLIPALGEGPHPEAAGR